MDRKWVIGGGVAALAGLAYFYVKAQNGTPQSSGAQEVIGNPGATAPSGTYGGGGGDSTSPVATDPTTVSSLGGYLTNTQVGLPSSFNPGVGEIPYTPTSSPLPSLGGVNPGGVEQLAK